MILETRKRRNLLIISFLFFALFANLRAEDVQCLWTGVKRIVVVGDIHGAYDNFVTILKETGMINESLHWTGGKTHFVQTGDLMDKGPDAKKAFDLMMRLEKEAEADEGKVHFLIGNHEELNIAGISLDISGYITPEQLVSFLPEKYREKKERNWRNQLGELAEGNSNSSLALEEALKNKWKELLKAEEGRWGGELRQLYTNTFNDIYGRWIIQHNSVIKINDIVFVHGGINLNYSTWKLKDINGLIRNELTECRLRIKREQQPKNKYMIVYQSNSPLWYRGLAREDEKIFKEELGQILKNLDARCIVIAHTPRTGSPVVLDELMSRFNGKVWVVDTGIYYYGTGVSGGVLSALIIEDEKFSVWGKGNE